MDVVVYLVVKSAHKRSAGFEMESSTSTLIVDDSLPDLIARNYLLQYLVDFLEVFLEVCGNMMYILLEVHLVLLYVLWRFPV